MVSEVEQRGLLAIHLRRDSQVIQMAEHVCPKREKVSGDTGQTRTKGQRIKKNASDQ